jgi:hypothetical protein
MTITETDRRRLHRALHASIGDEADILMNALPTDPDRLATRDDLRLQSAELRTDMGDLRTELRTGMADIRTEMSDLRTELRTGMADIRTEMADLGSTLRVEFHAATTGQTRTLLLGLIGTVVTMSTVQLVSLLALT